MSGATPVVTTTAGATTAGATTAGATPAVTTLSAEATARNKCVTTKPFGIRHPYSHCIKPSGEMVGTQVTSDRFTFQNTATVLGGIMNYVEFITINADKGTRDICKDDTSKNGIGSGTLGSGVIGNKYVLKTNIKCRPLVNTATGSTVSGEAFLHKYIDNATTLGGFLTGGAPQEDANGLLPSTFASAGKIGYNVMDVISAFSGNSKPYCFPVRLKCHIIDNKDSTNDYKGYSPDVHLSIDDIKNLNASFFENGTKPPNIPAKPVEGFSNAIDNIIYQNSDKLQNYSDFENVTTSIEFHDELLVKVYYIGFSVFLIILMFKLINKKQ